MILYIFYENIIFFFKIKNVIFEKQDVIKS